MDFIYCNPPQALWKIQFIVYSRVLVVMVTIWFENIKKCFSWFNILKATLNIWYPAARAFPCLLQAFSVGTHHPSQMPVCRGIQDTRLGTSCCTRVCRVLSCQVGTKPSACCVTAAGSGTEWWRYASKVRRHFNKSQTQKIDWASFNLQQEGPTNCTCTVLGVFLQMSLRAL